MYGDKLQPSSISLKLRRFTITVSNDGQTRVLRLRPVVLSTLLRSTRELKALGAISHPPRHETLVKRLFQRPCVLQSCEITIEMNRR